MQIRKNLAMLTAALGLTATVFIAQSCSKSKSPAKQTLYDSLGGTAMVADPANSGQMIEKGRLGLRSVVDSAIFVIAVDSKINKYFQTLLTEVGNSNFTGFNALSKNLTDFFCVATGARHFTYSGKNMHDAHDPATNSRMNGKVDSDDFDQFVADIVVAAKKNGLSDQLIGQVGVVIYSVKGVVVQM
ncbi:MAG TPA: hypothetical protein VHD83_24985 [Puia sp.]|nr:hypothetical protein [Puia sp.]